MFPKYFIKVFLFLLIIIIFMLLSVAFYTLMERKIMSINQYRVGPLKVVFGGLLQPVFDGFKLFLKMINSPSSNNWVFYISPVISFFISMVFWGMFLINNLFLKNMILLFLLGVGVYSFVLAGWASISKFGYLGGVRASTQTISYEVALTIILLMIMFTLNNFNFLKYEENMSLINLPIMIMWIIIIICETNRAPFDFAEGESELISGFNIEYGSGGFVLYFLSEYNMMIFFSLFTCLLFNLNYLFFFFVLFILISLRTSFPRFRYDFLQEFMWLKFLPFTCLLLLMMNILL